MYHSGFIPALKREAFSSHFRKEPSIGRRTFLAGGATACATALAGCSAIADYFAGLALSDLNLLNRTDDAVDGEVTVSDASGNTLLEDSFEVAAGNGGENGGDDVSVTQFDGIIDDEGEFTVVIDLEDGNTVGGESTATGSIELSNPDDEHLLVVFDSDDEDGSIVFDEIESLGDLEEYQDS